MNGLADPFKQLVEHKLWPIALVLLAALVAVPMLLKQDEETDTLPTPVAVTPAAAADASIVTLADAGKRDKLRAVLGDRKNPFRPAQLHRVKKADDGLTKAGVPTAVSAGAGGSEDGGATAGGDTGSGEPAATPTATPEPKTFELYSLKVRFGPTEGQLVTRNVKRLTGLPGGTHPAALYLGLLDDHKSAVFIIDAGVETLGDGHCDPSPEDCQTLTMKKGETEFLTRGDKQWELDLVDINVKKTTDEAAAKASRKTIAVDGRKKLKGLISRVGAFAYDENAGALEKVAKAEQAKRAAEAARSGGASRSSTFTTSG